MYRNLDPSALRALLQGDQPPLLVDVRSPDEVAHGQLVGARHIPLAELPRRYSEFSPEQPLVVYCHSGARSAGACRFLEERGFVHVYHLEGGLAAWLRAGYPLAI